MCSTNNTKISFFLAAIGCVRMLLDTCGERLALEGEEAVQENPLLVATELGLVATSHGLWRIKDFHVGEERTLVNKRSRL